MYISKRNETYLYEYFSQFLSLELIIEIIITILCKLFYEGFWIEKFSMDQWKTWPLSKMETSNKRQIC